MKLLLMFLLIPILCATVEGYTPGARLRLRRRRPISTNTDTGTKIDSEPESAEFEVIDQTVRWDPRKTAIVVCDMWDNHWCKGAAERVHELAPHMNEVLHKARERGIFIIHAPSDTIDHYTDTPQRLRAQEAPSAEPPESIHAWHSLDPDKEAPLPIDDSDGGCDDDPPCSHGAPWQRQHPAIDIAPADAISDQGAEVYNLLRERDITKVIVMGVHTNMCVLGRPFSIRRLVTLGFQVALMRDMTDTMYNSRQHPHVSHFRGTDLVIEHIEKYWCPTLTSADLTGHPEFRFQKDRNEDADVSLELSKK